MFKFRLCLPAMLLALLAACSGQGGNPNPASAYTANVVEPQISCSWTNGGVMAAKDSGGALTFLRSPVEHDDLAVVAVLQQYGPIPGVYGDALLRGVDDGTVEPYHGPGFVLWYFHEGLGLPSALPWTDSRAKCRARSPVVKSNTPGWVYVKVPHWARLVVPTDLLLAGPVCVRAKGLPELVHLPRLTEGSFAGRTDMLCGLPGRMQQIVSSGYNGVLFFFIVEGG